MTAFYESFLQTLDPKSINKACKKCGDHGICELTNGSMHVDAIYKFCDCDYLQELF